MSFNNITVTLSKYEVDTLIKAEVQKSFPNHIVHEVTVTQEGVQVKLKYNHGSYMDR